MQDFVGLTELQLLAELPDDPKAAKAAAEAAEGFVGRGEGRTNVLEGEAAEGEETVEATEARLRSCLEMQDRLAKKARVQVTPQPSTPQPSTPQPSTVGLLTPTLTPTLPPTLTLTLTLTLTRPRPHRRRRRPRPTLASSRLSPSAPARATSRRPALRTTLMTISTRTLPLPRHR